MYAAFLTFLKLGFLSLRWFPSLLTVESETHCNYSRSIYSIWNNRFLGILNVIHTLQRGKKIIWFQKRDIKAQLNKLLISTNQETPLHRQVYFLYLRYVHEETRITAAGVITLSYKRLLSVSLDLFDSKIAIDNHLDIRKVKTNFFFKSSRT